MDGKMLTAREIAEVLRVSRRTVYHMIERGELRAIRVGRLFRVRESDLQQYIGGLATVGEWPPRRPWQP